MSEQSFRVIVDTIPGLVAVMTAIGDVEHVNQQVLDYFGRTPRNCSDGARLTPFIQTISSCSRCMDTLY
jgi:PAS domain-containing protein